MTNITYIIAEDSMTVFVQGNTYTVSKSNPDWENILHALKVQDEESLVEFLNPSKKFQHLMKGNIEIRGGILFYKGKSISNSFIDRIIKMSEQGYDIDPLLIFLDNLMLNPSSTAVRELYLFLESCSLPITNDGHFLAYKRVKDDFKDFHTGTFDNSIGNVVEMQRNEVDDVRERTCSTGLHFCSLSYLKAFYPGQGKVVILKINPADVVSIPSDYNNAKGRTCKYVVVGEHPEPERDAFDTLVNNDYDDEYYGDLEDDDYEDYCDLCEATTHNTCECLVAEDVLDVLDDISQRVNEAWYSSTKNKEYEREKQEDEQRLSSLTEADLVSLEDSKFWNPFQERLRQQFVEFLVKDNHSHTIDLDGSIVVNVDMFLGNVDLLIPEGTIFKGYVDYRNSKDVVLPDRIVIERFLTVNDTNISTLPNNLSIGELLDIRGTVIRELPEDLEVAWFVICDKNQLTKIPEKFKDKIKVY